MYAQLVGRFSFQSEPYVASAGWQDLNWVDALQKATRLSHEDAGKLLEELLTMQPGHQYFVERDQSGEKRMLLPTDLTIL